MCQSEPVFERVAVAGAEPSPVRAGHRVQVERILAFAAHLPADDRFLIRQVFEFGAAVPDIARQKGCLRGVVYRRIQRILRRMRAPLFAYVVARQDLLAPPLARAGRLVAVEGLTLEAAAAALGCTLHTLRARIATIKTMAHREASALARRSFNG
jgi:DNA-directed RNA polymerase specialized sigma24 family protein